MKGEISIKGEVLLVHVQSGGEFSTHRMVTARLKGLLLAGEGHQITIKDMEISSYNPEHFELLADALHKRTILEFTLKEKKDMTTLPPADDTSPAFRAALEALRDKDFDKIERVVRRLPAPEINVNPKPN